MQAKYVGYSTDTGKNMTMAFGIFFFSFEVRVPQSEKSFLHEPWQTASAPGRFSLCLSGNFKSIILSSYCSFNFFLCSSSFILLKFQIPCFSYIVMRRCPGFQERVCKSNTSTSGDQSGTNLNLASAGAIRRHEDSSQSGHCRIITGTSNFVVRTVL